MIEVHLSTHFRGYTGGKKSVFATGNTIDELLANLDANYPGIRFRIINEQEEIRHHIKLFKNKIQVDQISEPLSDADAVHIIGALSGG